MYMSNLFLFFQTQNYSLYSIFFISFSLFSLYLCTEIIFREIVEENHM